MFPTISHIREVLPAVEGRPEFVVAQREWGTVIDYIYMADGAFDDPIRKECRGLKFDIQGNLIARPYAKFHNIGERPDTQLDVLPWHEPHVVLDKLDGSMIHVAGGLWMTRMGHTDVAKAAMVGMPEKVIRFAEEMDANGITAIFEWTSPRNRIVVKYDKDAWTLTGLRYKSDGVYVEYKAMMDMANVFGVDVVKAWDTSVSDVADFVRHTRELKDLEGYVVRWDSGIMVKMKADEYVLRHKSKDGLQHEKNVLRLILDGLVDDTIPLLSPEDGLALAAYDRAVIKGIKYYADFLTNFVHVSIGPDQRHPFTDRKTFALRDVPNLNQLLKDAAFKTYSGGDPEAAIREMMRKHLSSQNDVDTLRTLFSQSWESFYRAPKMDN